MSSNTNWQRFTNLDDAIPVVVRTPSPTCTYCGGSVETLPMKQGVCYGCYRELQDEYQKAVELADSLKPQMDDILNAVGWAVDAPLDALHAFGEVPQPEAEAMAAEAARIAHWLWESNPSPTKDDQIASFITSLTSDEREHAANIIDGISSRAWFDSIDPIEF